MAEQGKIKPLRDPIDNSLILPQTTAKAVTYSGKGLNTFLDNLVVSDDTIETETPSEVLIDADTLGGYNANDYVKVTDEINANKFGGQSPEYYGKAPVLLWENADPTAAFAAQTINIPESVNRIAIMFNAQTAFSTYKTLTFEKIDIYQLLEVTIWSSNTMYNLSRLLIFNENKIVFESGFINGTSDNNRAIPVKIYAIG